MTPSEIDAQIRQANEKLLATFSHEVERCGLSSYKIYFSPAFDLNTKKALFHLRVEILFAPEADDSYYWKELEHGKVLATKDAATGEEMFVIGNSYEAKTIFRAQLGFAPDSVPEIAQGIDAVELKEILETRKLIII